jgi:hypothetical protein
VHLDQLAILFSVFLALAPTTSNLATSQASDPIMDRLKKIESFAFGGVGFALASSQGELDYRAILSRKSAAADFEAVFRIGNPQAKCYALTGLRQVNSSRFESLVMPLRSSRTCVAVTRGCTTFSQSMADIVKEIRSGVYSGPLTHDLIPPPEPRKPPTTEQEETAWHRLLALFFSPSSKPHPPAAPPAPPPPPSETVRRHIACVAEGAVGSQ